MEHQQSRPDRENRAMNDCPQCAALRHENRRGLDLNTNVGS
jgi:hypothetical protein